MPSDDEPSIRIGMRVQLERPNGTETTTPPNERRWTTTRSFLIRARPRRPTHGSSVDEGTTKRETPPDGKWKR